MAYFSGTIRLLVLNNLSISKTIYRFCTRKERLKSMTITDIKKKLKSNNINFEEGYTCISLECKFCDSKNSSSKHCYFNKKTGKFMCPQCELSSNIEDVWNAFEKKKLLSHKDQKYVSRYSEKSDVPEFVLELIGVKNLKQIDLNKVGARYIPSENLLWFPLKNCAGKLVGEKIYNLLDKSEKSFQQSPSGLLKKESTTNSKAILVNNILDYLVLSIQKNLSYSIVCMPYALNAIPQECLPALEKYHELILWFKYDVSGWDSATSYASKLDENRCQLICPTDSTPSPFEAHQRKLNIHHILENASPITHKSIITFSTLKNDILSDLQNIEKVTGVKWKRFPMLNKILKGHRRGELSIMTGPTGSGKTTFISEYSLDLALQGVSTLWGSFEIRNARLASTLLRQFVGYSLENKLNEFERWANEFEKIPLYFMTFHGQQHLKVVMDAVEHAHYVYDIRHVVIDNLQFMIGLQNNRLDKYYEQDAIITAFRSFATKRNVHVTLIIHPRKERPEDDLTTSSIFGSAKAAQEADNVLIIQDKRLTSVRGKKFLQIVKNRYSGDLGIMPLNFDKESQTFSSNKNQTEK